MNISDIIHKLEAFREIYGNLRIYHLHDSVESTPRVKFSDTMLIQGENYYEDYELIEVTTEGRILIY